MSKFYSKTGSKTKPNVNGKTISKENKTFLNIVIGKKFIDYKKP